MNVRASFSILFRTLGLKSAVAMREPSEAFTVMREQRAREALFCLRLSGHNVKSGLLLDLGCGYGEITNYLSKQGIKCVGLDISKEKVKHANGKSSTGFILADGTRLPFKDACFSTVVSNDVLEHVSHRLAKLMLLEAKRTLKEAGRLYVSVMNRCTLSTHAETPFLTWLPRQCYSSKKYPYTPKSLRQLCGELGFACNDYTWFYAWRKVVNAQSIRLPVLNKIVSLMNGLGLRGLAYTIAKKISVILFVCEKG